MSDLLKAESHFAFGENWKSFLKTVDAEKVAMAEEGMRKLFPEGLTGTFLDIGCGSGLPALAAAHLGAAHIDGIDIDKNSVEATRTLLGQYLPESAWSARVESVFNLGTGDYDVVYSWGVLHHTGDMWRAIRSAAGMVKPGGLFAFALYRQTALCEVWKVEKKVYTKSPAPIQALLRVGYHVTNMLAQLVKLRSPFAYIRKDDERGMDFAHDVHDWLGGYPYESTKESEVDPFMRDLGFEKVRTFPLPDYHGLSGTGCEEYVYRKTIG
ncbi:MAG: class SAM-dependent methyltransferase [Gemmatimonadetes bacterium]|nr:class SAM-dependent methyltransferase [Gemmatimonadota bacterium]